MKLLITGATGFVGARLVRKLVKDGHEVSVLSRNRSNAIEKLGVPVDVYEWNPLSGPAPQKAVDHAEVIINLMGENISAKRWSDKQKEKIYNSRVIGTENLVKSINQRSENLKAFISTSAVGIYPKNTSSELTEDSSIADDFLATVCKDWESSASKCEKTERLFIPRVGVVFGEEDGALAKLLPIFKIGGGGPIGSGKGIMSWIHVDDLVDIYYQASFDSKYKGVANAVSPNPVSNKDFTKCLGTAVGMPAFFPVPPFMLQLIFGEMASIILDSQTVIPEFLNGIGHEFKNPGIQEALNEITNKKKNEHLPGTCLESFETFQFVPRDKKEVFNFFSNPGNLKEITPKELNFTMTHMSTEEIQTGTEIDYKLSKYGLPLRWKSLITLWDPQSQFADVQLNGPYSVWHHTHAFYEVPKGTIIHDKVLLKMPMGPLGFLVYLIFVKSDIKSIFNYRTKVLREKFQS